MRVPPLVSIITVTYQSRSLIDACLGSIAAHAGMPTESIVVDNASTDGTPARVAEAHPDAVLVPLSENRGFAAANNLGAQRARGEYLLLLNPDAELRPGALRTLLMHLQSDPRVAAAGPRLTFPDETPQDAAFTYPTLLMTWLEFFPHPARLLHSRWNGRLRPKGREPIAIDHPLGACMLIRRSAWEDVGDMDEGFFMYCEEVDWCMRAKGRGWTVAHVPAATAVHHGGASSSKTPESLIYLYESRRRLHRKHRGQSFRILAAAITRIGLVWERHRLRKRRDQSLVPDPEADRRIEAIEQVLRGALA